MLSCLARDQRLLFVPAFLTSVAMPSTKKPETNVPLGRARAFDTSFFVLSAICAGAALAVAWLQGPGRVVEIAVRYLGFLALLGHLWHAYRAISSSVRPKYGTFFDFMTKPPSAMGSSAS